MADNIEQRNRINFLDYLRVFSIFFVIILHTSAQKWYVTDINGFAWQTFNFYDSMTRWAVPVFVMMSGALFLNREITIARIYQKYILRLLIAYIVWSTFYCFSDGIAMSLENILKGKYHMWFILMMIGLYIAMPITQVIVKNKKILKYFLLLSFIFSFLIPFVNKVISDFFMTSKLMFTINKNIYDMNLRLVSGYVGYFILGYWLNSIRISPQKRFFIYFGGVMGFILTVVLQILVVLKIQHRSGSYYDNFSINVLLFSVAIFVWFKYSKVLQKHRPIIEILAKLSFGVYLVHPFVLSELEILGLNTLSFNPILSVPMISILVYIFSVGISYILNHIPILKKYIV